ncbi:MAG: HAMP domain-containing histidine kinase [SAR324 cluster bacterium]|nr:HAMP domain-containing histidine kinase [SAR324 cluster bacterium]
MTTQQAEELLLKVRGIVREWLFNDGTFNEPQIEKRLLSVIIGLFIILTGWNAVVSHIPANERMILGGFHLTLYGLLALSFSRFQLFAGLSTVAIVVVLPMAQILAGFPVSTFKWLSVSILVAGLCLPIKVLLITYAMNVVFILGCQFISTISPRDGVDQIIFLSMIFSVTLASRVLRTLAYNKVQKQKEHLAQTNENLKSKQAQLVHSAKLASLGEVMSGIAHELNNPLAIINMSAELALDEALKDEHGLYIKYNQQIMNQVDRMIKIINHMRDVSHTDSTRKRIENVAHLIERSFILLTEQFRLHGIEVIRQIDPDVSIYCNAGQLEQVFVNLLLNARDALDDWKGEKKLTIDVYQKNEEIFVNFTDTGMGIPQEIQSKIFDPFFSTKDVGKGTGLGLSIVHYLIQENEGTLLFSSSTGQGTTFSIKFHVTDSQKIS